MDKIRIYYKEDIYKDIKVTREIFNDFTGYSCRWKQDIENPEQYIYIDKSKTVLPIQEIWDIVFNNKLENKLSIEGKNNYNNQLTYLYNTVDKYIKGN